MRRDDATRLTRQSRSYGWFRSHWSSGYRQCPKCKTRIGGDGHGRDDALARSVNDAIDTAMVEHLTEEH